MFTCIGRGQSLTWSSDVAIGNNPITFIPGLMDVMSGIYATGVLLNVSDNRNGAATFLSVLNVTLPENVTSASISCSTGGIPLKRNLSLSSKLS